MIQPLYSVTVPCTEDSITVLEDLCETFLTAEHGLPDRLALIMRLSVTEACRNALNRDPAPGRMGITGLSFWRTEKELPWNIGLEISDTGVGLEVDGHTPPYPEIMVGREFRLCRLRDEQLVARILSPCRARIRTRELSSGAHEISRLAMMNGNRERGLGLMTLCGCWNSVLFEYHPARGNTLKLDDPGPDGYIAAIDAVAVS